MVKCASSHGSGFRLSVSRVQVLARGAGALPRVTWTAWHAQEIDTDGSGQVSFEEFCEMCGIPAWKVRQEQVFIDRTNPRYDD